MVLLCSVVSCEKEEGIVIRGKISNLENPYLLVSYISADTLSLDTLNVDVKGKFNYKNQIDTLTSFSIYLNDYQSAVLVFADKGEKLKVNGDALLPDLIEVNGNEINDDLTLFKMSNKDVLAQRGQLLKNLSMDPQASSDSSHIQALSRQEDMAKLQLLNHELIARAEEFVKLNPAKFSSLILINNFFVDSDNPQVLERVMELVQGEVLDSEYASRLKYYAEKMSRSGEGKPMPYFMLKDNEEKDLFSHQFSGKYLLLSFVSSAGIESRETIGLLKEAYDKLDKDSVEFLTIYIDTDLFPVEYVENDSIPWKVVPEKRSWGSDVVDAYNVQYIPFNMLIGPDGLIKARNIPAQSVESAIKNSTEN